LAISIRAVVLGLLGASSCSSGNSEKGVMGEGAAIVKKSAAVGRADPLVEEVTAAAEEDIGGF
jgi:hypothetical protein